MQPDAHLVHLAFCLGVRGLKSPVFIVLQRGPPYGTGLQRIEAGFQEQINKVVDLVLRNRLTPLQRASMENVIITKVSSTSVGML